MLPAALRLRSAACVTPKPVPKNAEKRTRASELRIKSLAKERATLQSQQVPTKQYNFTGSKRHSPTAAFEVHKFTPLLKVVPKPPGGSPQPQEAVHLMPC